MKTLKPPRNDRKPERDIDREARRLLKGPEMRRAYDTDPNFRHCVHSLASGNPDPVLVMFMLCEVIAVQAEKIRRREMEAMQNAYRSCDL